MSYRKKKLSSGFKGIVTIVILINLIIIAVIILSFIPLGDTILFDDVDITDLGEVVIFISILIGVSVIFLILIFKRNYKRG